MANKIEEMGLRKWFTDELGYTEKELVGETIEIYGTYKEVFTEWWTVKTHGQSLVKVCYLHKKMRDAIMHLHRAAPMEHAIPERILDFVPTFAAKENCNFFLFPYQENNKEKVIVAMDGKCQIIKDWRKMLSKDVFGADKKSDTPVIIQQRIFDYLVSEYDKTKNSDNPLFFKLRKNNLSGRLDLGYYFLGNDDYCVVSFWGGDDTINKSPHIYWQIIKRNTCQLIFSSKNTDDNVALMNMLAGALSCERVKTKGKELNLWIKIYYADDFSKDYLESLKNFVEKDRLIIDAFLKSGFSKTHTITNLDKTEFEELLARALELRKKFSEKTTPVNITEAIKYPIQLKTLKLNNIGHFENLSIDLSKRVICILGENGIGKTSILRAIALGLVGFDQTDKLNASNPSLKNLLRIAGIDRIYPKRAPKGSITLEYYVDKFYRNVIDFAPQGLTEKDEVFINDNPESADNTPSFGTLVDGQYFNHLVLGFSQVRGKQNRVEIEGSKLTKPEVADVLPLILDQEDDRLENLKPWLIDLYLSANKKAAKSGELADLDKTETYKLVLDTIFKIISDVIGQNIKPYEADVVQKTFWVQEEDKAPVLFELLSQGFRNVFGWIGHFVKRLAESTEYSLDFLKEPAIVLIDEIDAYLHPKWQRNILNVLAVHFPKTQFIVTTHSPLVVSYLKDVPAGDRVMYVLQKGEENLIVYSRIYGRSIKDVFWDWMGIQEYPSAMQHKIDRVLGLIHEETVESLKTAEELYTELQQDLNNTDGIMVEIGLSLTMAKEYLKDMEEKK